MLLYRQALLIYRIEISDSIMIIHAVDVLAADRVRTLLSIIAYSKHIAVLRETLVCGATCWSEWTVNQCELPGQRQQYRGAVFPSIRRSGSGFTAVESCTILS